MFEAVRRIRKSRRTRSQDVVKETAPPSQPGPPTVAATASSGAAASGADSHGPSNAPTLDLNPDNSSAVMAYPEMPSILVASGFDTSVNSSLQPFKKGSKGGPTLLSSLLLPEPSDLTAAALLEPPLSQTRLTDGVEMATRPRVSLEASPFFSARQAAQLTPTIEDKAMVSTGQEEL